MGMDEGLRERLEALNRGAIVLPTQRARVVERPASKAVAHGARAWRGGAVKPVVGLMRRGDVVETSLGCCWRIVVPIDELWPGGESLVERRHAAVRGAAVDGESDDTLLAGFPQQHLFLDLETCGLAGSALFLAGLLRAVERRWVVELLVARDYSEEPAVLAALWERLAGTATIVTFNGKSFDWPMVIDRSRRHLLAISTSIASIRHIDLLHLSRRRWGAQLADCKLQTLERHICGRRRADDMPGSQIPAAYQQFVRTGFERDMDAILLHNAIDLVTMLDLIMRLA